jgi:hypothetical protein
MSKKKDRITKGLKEIGAAWAVRNDRYCSPNDPLEDQVARKRTYHVHPDASYPHQNHIIRFRNLDEIAAYIKVRKAAEAAEDEVEGYEIMEDFFNSLLPL